MERLRESEREGFSLITPRNEVVECLRWSMEPTLSIAEGGALVVTQILRRALGRFRCSCCCCWCWKWWWCCCCCCCCSCCVASAPIQSSFLVWCAIWVTKGGTVYRYIYIDIHIDNTWTEQKATNEMNKTRERNKRAKERELKATLQLTAYSWNSSTVIAASTKKNRNLGKPSSIPEQPLN